MDIGIIKCSGSSPIMLWIMRLRGNNNKVASTESRPARKEYNQLSSKDGVDSTYTAKDSRTFLESNGNGSCSESDPNCTDVDSNDDLDENQHGSHWKKKSSNLEDDNSNIIDETQTNSCSKRRNRRHSNHDIFSDDSECDEALTCNVCDRSFPCQRQLESHQQKKRHFGCSACDTLYLSLMALEHHKEEFQHWSDDEEYCSAGYDSESSDDTAPSEDCERLL